MLRHQLFQRLSFFIFNHKCPFSVDVIHTFYFRNIQSCGLHPRLIQCLIKDVLFRMSRLKHLCDSLFAAVYFFVWTFYNYIFQFHKITSCLSKLFFIYVYDTINSCRILHMKYENHLVAVVGFQVKLFDFAHQWISRVCPCTLVVECLLYHLIQCCKEVFFLDTPFFNRLRNSDRFL